MVSVAAADQVRSQVENLVLRHAVEQAGWHGRRFRDCQTVDRLAVNGDLLVWYGQVRIQHERVAVEVDDDSRVDEAGVGDDGDRRELLVDHLAGVNDLIEQVVRRISTTG